MIFWNFFASAEALDVGDVIANSASVLSVKASQSARLKFVNALRRRAGGESSLLMSMVMGRWSEFSLTWVFQDESAARWAEMIDTSGELGLPFEGSRVGKFSLIVIRLLLLMQSFNTTPRCRASSLVSGGAAAGRRAAAP